MNYERLYSEPIRVPVTIYVDVTFGPGFKMLLLDLLFPNASGVKRQLVYAIRAVRAELGIGLKEAKDVCEALTPFMLGGSVSDQDSYERNSTLGDLLRTRMGG